MTNETKQKFGNAIMEARNNLQLTQRDCAKHCGVSIVSYQNWEHGTCEPKPDKLNLICEFLGLNKEDFK